ncbi:Kinesin-like protein KIN-5B [Linum grandiflorum]
MPSCMTVTDQSEEPRYGSPGAKESPIIAGENENENDDNDEEEEEEEEDVDFNPFLKGTPSPEASSSLSSEMEGPDDTLSTKPMGDAQSYDDVGHSEHGEEVVMQTAVSSSEGEPKSGKPLQSRGKKRKLDSTSELENDPVLKEFDVDDIRDDEDAICKRTRARYSLARFTLDELETFLQETDDEDDLQNVDDEEEYRKFLAAVLHSGEGDDQSAQAPDKCDDEDEENDADFEIELEELLDTDIDDTIRDKDQKMNSEEGRRRPETRQNRSRETSVRHKKKLLEQEILHKCSEVRTWKTKSFPGICFSPPYMRPSVADEFSNYLPAQCSTVSSHDRLSQMLITQSCSKERVHSALDMQKNTTQAVESFWVPSVRGPILSVLDVAPLHLVGKFVEDICNAGKEYQRRCVEPRFDAQYEKEPLFQLPYYPSLCEGIVQREHDSSTTDAAPSTPGQQLPKKTLAAAIVERAKKQSIALVPRDVSKLAQRFSPFFNPSLFPHKSPPTAVANRILFTDAEDELLALGMMEYNTDWKAIQQRFLPSKSKHQAVRKMKTSPLSAEEIERIQEGLRFCKLDWMSIWKFIVPYRDPSLLPRQWRLALGTQKSYKQDAAKKERRRVCESNRRSKAAELLNQQMTVDREENQLVSSNSHKGRDHSVENVSESYVHQAFLAEWAPVSSSPILPANLVEKGLPGNLSNETHQLRKQPKYSAPGESQNQSGNMHVLSCTMSPFTQSRNSPGTTQQNQPAFQMTVDTSSPKIYLWPYQTRKVAGASLVKLAPELPPVNLPPSVRVISQSAFRNNQFGILSRVSSTGCKSDSGKEGIPPRLLDNTNQRTTSSVPITVVAGDGVLKNTTTPCREDSSVTNDACQEESENNSDLQMHPLLFKTSDAEPLRCYPLKCTSDSSRSLHLNLSLFHNPRQINPAGDSSGKSAGTEGSPASGGIDFHPLLQQADGENSNSVMAPSNILQSVSLGYKSRQDPYPGVVAQNTTASKVISQIVKANELDLEIHLSPASRKEKKRRLRDGNLVKESTSAKDSVDCVSAMETCETGTLCHRSSERRPTVKSSLISEADAAARPGSNIDDVGGESQQEIVMEQEELSDSDEEFEENVEFECEEMTDSDGEEGSSSKSIFDDQAEAENLCVGAEKVVSDKSCAAGIGSPALKLSLTMLGKDENSNTWLSLDTGTPVEHQNVTRKQGSLDVEGEDILSSAFFLTFVFGLPVERQMSISLTPDQSRKVGLGVVPSPCPFLTPRPERRRPDSRGSDRSSIRLDRDKEVNVQVLLRCRPLSDEEQRANVPKAISCNEQRKEVTVLQSVANKQVDRAFSFDKVFGPKAQQRAIYDQAISPIVKEVLDGFNCTVFAYGQTGTGKTYTMEGGMRNKGGDLPAEAGVIPRAVRQIFDTLEGQKADYSMKVTFLELYNEEIADLLATEDNARFVDDRQKKPISLMEDGRGCVVVRGLEEEVVYSANDIYTLLERGAAKRRTADTLLNKRSRDSKLTRLLRDSLGGKTKTCIIATISPSGHSLEETLSTLDYAHRAKNIRNKPEANQKISKAVLLKDLLLEIDRMKEDVRAARERNGVYIPHDRFAMEEAEKKERIQKIEQLEVDLNLSKKEVAKFRELYLSEQEQKLDMESELNECQVNLEKSNKDLLDLRENYRVAISTLKEKEFIISKLLCSDQKVEMETENQRMVLRFGSQLDQSLKDLHRTVLGSVSQQQHQMRSMEEHAQSFLASKCDATKDLELRIKRMADTFSSGIESLKKFADNMRETSSSDLEQLNNTISSQVTASEQGLERSLRHAQMITKATMDFFNDINVQASKVTTVLEESQIKQSDMLSNFQMTFQEETVREEKQALEDITKILRNLTSKRTTMVAEASRSMRGLRTEEHRKILQEMNYIHQISTDANDEMNRYAQDVNRNFTEDSFSVAESRVIMKECIRECSNKVNDSREQWENAESNARILNQSMVVGIGSAVREKNNANNAVHQEFLSASSAVDEDFSARTVDLMGAVQDTLKRDKENTNEVDAMTELCMNQLKSIQEKHGESVANIRNKAEKCLTQEYQVDEDTSSRPERREIPVPSLSSIEKMRMSFASEENMPASPKLSPHNRHRYNSESKIPAAALLLSSRAPLGDLN